MRALILPASAGPLDDLFAGGAPMAPVLDRPMIWHLLTALKDWGVTEVTVVRPTAPALRNYVGDGLRWGLAVTDHGTGTPTVVVPADLLPAGAPLALTGADGPSESAIIVGDDGRPIAFFFADGVETQVPFDEFACLMQQAAPCIDGPMAGLMARRPASTEDVLQANLDALRGLLPVFGSEAAEVAPGVFVGPGAAVEPSARLEAPVFIGAGVFVGAGAVVSNAVVGEGSAVGRSTAVSSSVVGPATYVGNFLSLDGVVVQDSRLAQGRGGSLLHVDDPFYLSSVGTVPHLTACDVVCGIRDLAVAWGRRVTERWF